MLRLLQRCCSCGTTDRPDGPPSGAALSDEPSAADCGTNDDELTYSAPGNLTLALDAPALVTGYTPSAPSGTSAPPSASTIRGGPDEAASEVSDTSLLVQLFQDPATPKAESVQCASAGGRAVGNAAQANPGMAEHDEPHSRSSCAPKTGAFQSCSGRSSSQCAW
eukprot:TRINITY_DN4388_c0_g1_i1.p1 TRINITY_DN4388_c0_g1~~TRINITY_DN4388_c0_g1_i1.p1  ORF type:complete len:165 (+),score=23.07 TRINITY_DN4388_c0_g1_i1:78-572(+)